ncbi:MAG: 5'-methylthioadenosine nucleosidase, partial [Oscillospiraceae bacterium]
MKKIGMLVAVEIDAVLKQFGEPKEPVIITGYKIYKYNLEDMELFVIHSGAGEIAAASATQLLISSFGVELLINFGVVGGLTEEMALSKTCIVEKVVHYDFDTSDYDHCEVGRYMDYPDV